LESARRRLGKKRSGKYREKRRMKRKKKFLRPTWRKKKKKLSPLRWAENFCTRREKKEGREAEKKKKRKSVASQRGRATRLFPKVAFRDKCVRRRSKKKEGKEDSYWGKRGLEKGGLAGPEGMIPKDQSFLDGDQGRTSPGQKVRERRSKKRGRQGRGRCERRRSPSKKDYSPGTRRAKTKSRETAKAAARSSTCLLSRKPRVARGAREKILPEQTEKEIGKRALPGEKEKVTSGKRGKIVPAAPRRSLSSGKGEKNSARRRGRGRKKAKRREPCEGLTRRWRGKGLDEAR